MVGIRTTLPELVLKFREGRVYKRKVTKVFRATYEKWTDYTMRGHDKLERVKLWNPRHTKYNRGRQLKPWKDDV